MDVSVAATPAEVAAIRRRYLLMMASVYVVDLAFSLIYLSQSGNWSYGPYTLIPGAVVLLGANLPLATALFRPIDRFLRGDATFESAQRRITQLPLLSARNVAALELVLTTYRLTTQLWFDPAFGLPELTIADGDVPASVEIVK